MARLFVLALALAACRAEPECIAHVECAADERCVDRQCAPLAAAADMDAPDQPRPPPPDMRAPPPDAAAVDAQPADVGPDAAPVVDAGPVGPDRTIFQSVIAPTLDARCSSCHPGPARPGDGQLNIPSDAFALFYEEVQEFLNLDVPDQSRLLRRPTGEAHPIIWRAGDPDYQRVLLWIEG
ncbi:MAG: hypothetical protein H6706_13065 [Myxococcales bacterium]|nr:hypothetical protein [Myxococcales bacterium]